ncbi:hypothetical protein [Myxococcus phage Mx1]|nr:hypothetical protein [Myxococcus phage Mx1]
MRLTEEGLDAAVKVLFEEFGVVFVAGWHDHRSQRHSNLRIVAEHCFLTQRPEDDNTRQVREALRRLNKDGYFRFD